MLTGSARSTATMSPTRCAVLSRGAGLVGLLPTEFDRRPFVILLQALSWQEIRGTTLSVTSRSAMFALIDRCSADLRARRPEEPRRCVCEQSCLAAYRSSDRHAAHRRDRCRAVVTWLSEAPHRTTRDANPQLRHHGTGGPERLTATEHDLGDYVRTARSVVYVGNNGTQLFVRRSTRLEAGCDVPSGTTPRTIHFPRQPMGRLRRRPDDAEEGRRSPAARPSRLRMRLTDSRGARAWLTNDTIVVATNNAKHRASAVPAAGGPATVLDPPRPG